jgi:hypothetical protein
LAWSLKGCHPPRPLMVLRLASLCLPSQACAAVEPWRVYPSMQIWRCFLIYGNESTMAPVNFSNNPVCFWFGSNCQQSVDLVSSSEIPLQKFASFQN